MTDGDAYRAGRWHHNWTPLDLAAAKEKFHGRVPKGWTPEDHVSLHGENAGQFAVSDAVLKAEDTGKTHHVFKLSTGKHGVSSHAPAGNYFSVTAKGDWSRTVGGRQIPMKDRPAKHHFYKLEGDYSGNTVGRALAHEPLGNQRMTDTWATRYTPAHLPAGSPAGGQFAPASGSSQAGKNAGDKRPTPGNQHPVGMGETGKRVSDLQKRLNALGAHLAVDGKFGPKTLAAVRAFQKAHNLKVDGLVGPHTTAALRAKAPAAHHVPAKPAPVKVAKPAPVKASRTHDAFVQRTQELCVQLGLDLRRAL